MSRASLGALGAGHYTPRQIAGLFVTTETVDPRIIADGTFFVAERGGRVIGSGAWTRRAAGYESRLPPIGGSRRPEVATIRSVFVAPDHARRGIAREIMDIVESDAVLHGAVILDLVATLPGIPLYRALGYAPADFVDVTLVNGVRFSGLRMVKHVLADGASLAA